MRPPFLHQLIYTLAFIIIAPVWGLAYQSDTLTAYHQKAFKAAQKAKENGTAAYHAYELARQAIHENQNSQALGYLSDCSKYAARANDPLLLRMAYQSAGDQHMKAQNYNKAASNYQKALKSAEKSNATSYQQTILVSLGNAYMMGGKDKRAIRSLQEALSIAIALGDRILQQQCYLLLANTYEHIGDKEKHIEYLNLHNGINKKIGVPEENTAQISTLEKEIEQAGEIRQAYDEALLQQNRQLRIREDSLLAIKYSLKTTAESLQEVRDSAATQRLEILLLNRDKALNEFRLKEQANLLRHETLMRNSILVGLLLASTLVVVIVLGYRRKVADNNAIALQNKNIQSSINYAKRIQEAMLHRSGLDNFPFDDAFVLYKPRDVVSGDFYYVSEIKSWYDPDVVFAAVDCTGHGIPGAFMSLIGMNALNGIIKQGIAEPDQILAALDQEVRETLQQENTGNQDGMDIALCIYRREKNILEFAGAKNPLFYIQDHQLHKIKGSRNPVGGYQIKKKQQNEAKYTNHVVAIDRPTTVYLFSDGYQDQFGGKDDTKFMSKRFKALLLEIHQLPMAEQKERLASTLAEWRGETGQTDDILVMGVQFSGEPND